MPDFCQEVSAFVSACEAIHAMLSQGGILTPDEKGVIEISAIELLAKLRLE